MKIEHMFHQEVTNKMQAVIDQQLQTIEDAADVISTAKDNGHNIYFFGSGHSYIVGQEVFARAGGYAGFLPILENDLGMNHAFKSTLIERTKEYASVILGLYDFQAGDVIVMTSNSGRNQLIIELALRLKELGLHIIALTALQQSKLIKSRHCSGKRLYELADLVLDNQSSPGDACIKHNDQVTTGPTSTIMNCYIIQLLVSVFVQKEIDKGKDVPVFISSNTDAGDAHNQAFFQSYK